MKRIAIAFASAIFLVFCAGGRAQNSQAPERPQTKSQLPAAASSRSVSTAAPSSESSSSAKTSYHWYKGNTHTHTTVSDGDSTPIIVVRWYRDHDYDFLALSDHCEQVRPAPLQEEINLENAKRNRKPFLLVAGEENGAKIKKTDRPRAVHVQAIGASRKIGMQHGENLRDGLQKCVNAINSAGGLACVNHPNFMWSLTADDLMAARDVNAFEVYNGHPGVHNLGGSGHPGTEQIWDDVLSRGRLYYGFATDDAHTFQKWESGSANPGRGWVMVRAKELSQPALIEAMRQGDFYATSGVVLDEVSTDNSTLSLKIHQRSNFGYRTHFIGKGGAILAEDETTTPCYRLKPEDLYVRARVTSSGGQCAWTQPLFARGGGAR